jgi:hypothetical protein
VAAAHVTAGHVTAVSTAAMPATVSLGNGRKDETARSQGQRGQAHDECMSYALFHVDFLERDKVHSGNGWQGGSFPNNTAEMTPDT